VFDTVLIVSTPTIGENAEFATMVRHLSGVTSADVPGRGMRAVLTVTTV